MINEFTLEEFTRLVVKKVETTGIETTLSNPSSDAVFPIGVVTAPMENVIRTNDDNVPIKKVFSITVEWWTNSKYESMRLNNECIKKLRTLNMIQTGNTTPRYDEITQKNIIGAIYEVNYNGLTNSFEKKK